MGRPKVIIKVEGGIVQEVYSDTDLDIEVFDIDDPDFATEEDLRELEENCERLAQYREKLNVIY